jgi:hypothetical protein
MRKYLLKLMALAAFVSAPFTSSAQQTVEEATDSIKAILTSAKEGNAAAQNEVGGWYYRGRHVKQDFKEAAQWWAKAAKQGNVQAIGNLGLCYQTGHGTEVDSLKAVQLYQKSIKAGNKGLFEQHVEFAKKGNLFSNLLVASCYQNGIGVTKNPVEAVPYLKVAAQKHSVVAQRDLGLILLNSKKPNEAVNWFKQGAESGDLTCTFYYGKMLIEGLGISANPKEGANYLLKAAEAGFPQAQYYVGNCYMSGTGLTKNSDQAVVWYRKAAGNGVSNAQWALAQCYREGNGTPVNYDQAMYWYAEAVSKGHSKAFKQLVKDSIPESPFVAYLKGMKSYINKDFDSAFKDFKIVEKAKVVDGKVMEAAIVANNSYAKHNMKKGIKLLTDAAKTNAQAMYLLAALYEAGKGVDKNMDLAVDYMTKAANAGYGAAECALGDMYYEGRGVPQDYSLAVQWYNKANEQGQLAENSAKRLAECYKNGWGANKDESMANTILSIAHISHISQLLKEI